MTKPKGPGQKLGSGTFHYRAMPLPEQVTAPPVDVPVTCEACPDRGWPLAQERVDVVYITDLPPLSRLKVMPTG